MRPLGRVQLEVIGEEKLGHRGDAHRRFLGIGTFRIRLTRWGLGIEVPHVFGDLASARDAKDKVKTRRSEPHLRRASAGANNYAHMRRTRKQLERQSTSFRLIRLRFGGAAALFASSAEERRIFRGSIPSSSALCCARVLIMPRKRVSC